MNVREKKNHWRERFRHPEKQEANLVVAILWIAAVLLLSWGMEQL